MKERCLENPARKCDCSDLKASDLTAVLARLSIAKIVTLLGAFSDVSTATARHPQCAAQPPAQHFDLSQCRGVAGGAGISRRAIPGILLCRADLAVRGVATDRATQGVADQSAACKLRPAHRRDRRCAGR